jgi:uncharacterized repeat protein (TIGR04042 family)
MPEMHFRIEWPGGEQQTCYSPSLVIKEYFQVGASYDIEEFERRSREALAIAGERVRQKYGYACSMAEAESARLTETAERFRGQPGAQVRVLEFIE